MPAFFGGLRRGNSNEFPERIIYPGRRSLSPGELPAPADTRFVIIESYNFAELLVLFFSSAKWRIYYLTQKVLGRNKWEVTVENGGYQPSPALDTS